MFQRICMAIGLGLTCVVQAVVPAVAETIDITLSSNPPQISDELSDYLSASFNGIHRVGFNAADVGQGGGDGLNEIVAFSFEYDPILLPISSATLALDITKPSVLDTSDHILIADNNTPFTVDSMNPYYGNAQLGSLSPNSNVTVSLDLTNISTNLGLQGILGAESLAHLLADGEFGIVYFDDATIHSARLTIRVVPEPTTLVAACILFGCAFASRMI